MTGAPGFYETDGLNVETYDARHGDLSHTPVAGDVDFFVELAREHGGPVLELASGTGRVALALAAAGSTVTGLELSPAMLRRAQANRDGLAAEVRERATFVRGDMRSFDLGAAFALVIVPFRGFQGLMTPQDQRDCLESVRRHLAPGGLFVVDLFDPRLHRCTPGDDPRSSVATS